MVKRDLQKVISEKSAYEARSATAIKAMEQAHHNEVQALNQELEVVARHWVAQGPHRHLTLARHAYRHPTPTHISHGVCDVCNRTPPQAEGAAAVQA